jgi:hypothetical protein
MKKGILTAFLALTLASLNPCDAQTPQAQSNSNAPSSSVSPVTTNLPVGVAQPPTVNTQQRTAASSTAAPPSATIAFPSDIGSQTVKEILSANNQVLSQVASMYQNLGLFITIIVTLVGGIATWMSYIARKSVHEFIQEWTKKMESLENDMKEALKRLHDAVAEAEASVKRAATHEQSIEDSKKVVNKTLEDVDRLRVSVESLYAQHRGEVAAAAPEPVAEAAVEQPPSEPLSAEEDAEVAARLKDKINSPEGEG